MLRDLKPTDNVGGFDVRPGNFLLNGATTVSGGVNFTIHSVYAVECTLLLFRPYAKFPYARLRFPDSYKIGNTYSMLVFGLDEIDFEYAYSFDGPYEPEKGIIFDKKKYILDPYAKAVIGQSGWGKKQEHEGVYKARVVNSDYDWGNCTQPKLPSRTGFSPRPWATIFSLCFISCRSSLSASRSMAAYMVSALASA